MSQDYEDDLDEGAGASDERRPPADPAVRSAASRTNAPGILLIVCGVLNLLAAFYMVANAGYTFSKSPEEFAAQEEMTQDLMAQVFPGAKEQIEQERQKQKQSPQQARTQALVVNFAGMIVWLLSAIVPILAGIRMRSLRSYGLSVTGAIVAAIPCLSIASCPCFLGMIFGIWALIVLLNPDVKNAFS